MNIPMTVMQHEKGKNEFLIINLRDVDFIEKEKSNIVYYIGNDKYYQINTKQELEDLLYEAGFDSLDRSNLVNMGKIKSFDKNFGKVYFEEPPKRDSVYATVAKVKEKAVEQFVNFVVHDNKDMQNEINLPQVSNGWFKSIMKGQSK